MSDTVNAGMLRAFVERIERVEEEIKTLNGDKSEIYKEARGHGYDVKAIRAVVAKRKLDSAEREEREAIFDLYWSALHGGSHVHVHTHVEKIDEFDAETGEINETQERPSHNAEASPEAGPQAEASLAGIGTGTLAGHEGRSEGEAASADLPTIPDDDVPAFLKKDSYVLRPHCLNPSLCAGSGREHCHACKRAMADSEAA